MQPAKVHLQGIPAPLPPSEPPNLQLNWFLNPSEQQGVRRGSPDVPWPTRGRGKAPEGTEVLAQRGPRAASPAGLWPRQQPQ